MAKLDKPAEKASAMPTKKKQKKVLKEDESQETNNAYELIRLRNYFYRDNYRRLISLLFFLSVAMVLLIGTVVYLYTHQPSPRYFATNIQGQLIELEPMNQPSLSQAELLEWARRAAVSAFTINYVQFRQQLETTKDTYFTQEGGQDYLDSLNTAGVLARIQQAQLIMTAEPTSAPTLIQTGVLSSGLYKNRYFWQVAVSLKVTEQNINILRSRLYDVQLVIVRSSALVDTKAINLDAAKGIGVGQFLSKFSSNVT